MIKYPAAIDTEIELPYVVDNFTPVSGQLINNLRDAVVAMENELGTKPSGIYSNVRSRIVALETTVGNLVITGGGGGTYGGDLATVTPTTQKVIGLQGRSLSSLAPSDGYLITWNALASEWQPLAPPVGFSAGGDLNGTATSQTVIAIQNNSISNVPPTDGYALIWVQSANEWQPKPVAQSIESVQNGKNYGNYLDVIAFPNTPSTDQSVFVTGATFVFDPSILTSANGTREIKLRVVGQTTSPTMTVQLYNITNNEVVTNSTLTTNSASSVLLETGDLTAYLPNSSAIYEIQIKMAAGTPTDRVTLGYGGLRVEWS